MDPRSEPITSGKTTADLEATRSHRGANTDSDPERTTDFQAANAPPNDAGRGGATGRFRVLNLHAQGGLGQVSIAVDTELGRRVALKEIRPPYADDPGTRRRFLREAELTGNLEHPGIVPVYGLGRGPDGRPFYAMRLIHGESLKEVLTRYHDSPIAGEERRLERDRLLRRFVDVCNAVAFAHSRGVVHRDLKPANIMLGEFGETLVVDWGLARGPQPPDHQDGQATLFRDDAGDATRPGDRLGTPPYMSPEQAAGRIDELGPPSDVYSLGATLYVILTGQAPFAGSLATILAAVERGGFPPPRAIRPEIPRPLEAICLKAMALAPGDRYASARDLALDLERWLADGPVAAFHVTPWRRLARWARRHRRRLAIASAVAALLVVASLATVLAIQQAGHARVLGSTLDALNASRDAEKQAVARSRALTASLALERGLALADTRPERALLTLAGGLEAAEVDPDGLGRVLRTNLAAWSRLRPTLVDLLGADGGAQDVAFSPDGRTLVTGAESARLWRLEPGGARPVASLAHPKRVTRAAFHPEGRFLATGCGDGRVRLWDTASGTLLADDLEHPQEVFGLAFSPDGRSLATGCNDGSVRLWNLANRQPRFDPLTLRGQAYAVAFSPDSQTFAVGTTAGPGGLQGGELRLVRADTGQPRDVAFEPIEFLLDLAFLPDGRTLLAAGAGGVHRLDVGTGKHVGAILEHQQGAMALDLAPDGRSLLTSGFDLKLRLWDLDQHALRFAPIELPDQAWAVAFHPDGRTFAAAGADRVHRLWKQPDGPPTPRILATAPLARFRPDGQAIVTVSEDGVLRVLPLPDSRPIRPPTLLGAQPSDLAIQPDGRAAALALGNEARVVPLADQPDPPRTFPHDGLVTAVAFSPDGQRLATGCADGSARVWEIATARPLTDPLDAGSPITDIDFAPDGGWIIVGTRGGYTRAWDTHALDVPLAPYVHATDVRAIAHLPGDGRLVLVADAEGTLRVWSKATAAPSGGEIVHPGGLRSAAFDPTGRVIASAGADGTLRLWDRASKRPLAPPYDHPRPLRFVEFRPDGTELLTIDTAGAVRLWPLPAPLEGSPEGVRLRVELGTGSTLDDAGDLQTLTEPDWNRRRRLLHPPAGPPSPP